MRTMHRVRVLALLLAAFILAPSGAGDAAAQAVSDSIRQAALRDLHGRDGQGKDGPLAKAGLDLLILYHRYRAAQAAGTAFDAGDASTAVYGGRVTIDAIAADEAQALQEDLERLGLRDGAHARRLVSGRLPIPAIPEAAQLSSLLSLRMARAVTRDGAAPPSGVQTTPSPRLDTGAVRPDAGEGTTTDSAAAAPSADTGAATDPPSSDAPTPDAASRSGEATETPVGYVLLILLGVVVGGAAIGYALRRRRG